MLKVILYAAILTFIAALPFGYLVAWFASIASFYLGLGIVIMRTR